MPKILLIDADKRLLNEVALELTRAHYDVIKASSAPDAIFRIKNEKFDMVVVDPSMPALPVKQWFNVLEGSVGNREVPVLVVTFDPASALAEMKNHAQVTSLAKPAPVSDILNRVKATVGVARYRSPIDVRFINPVLEAAKQVLSEAAESIVSPGIPYVRGPNEVSGDISGIVGVVSVGFQGTISLSFDEEPFLKLIAKMLQTEMTAIDSDNSDGIAELLNIMFGRAKDALNATGMAIRAAIPSVIVGKAHSVDHHSKFPALVIPFRSPGFGFARIEICYRDI